MQFPPAHNAPLLFGEEGPVFPHETPHGATQLKRIVSELCHGVKHLHDDCYGELNCDNPDNQPTFTMMLMISMILSLNADNYAKSLHQIHFDDDDFDFSDDHLLIIKIMITKSTCFKDLLIMKIITMSTKVDLLQTILVPDQQGVLWHSCLNLQHFWRCLKCLTFRICSGNVLLPGET